MTDPPSFMNGMNLALYFARRARIVCRKMGLKCPKQREMTMNATGRRVLTSIVIMTTSAKSACRGSFFASLFQAIIANHLRRAEGGKHD